MVESLAPPLHKDPGIQSRRRSHPPVRCRDLGSLSEADQATGAVSPTLLALHPWHQMARPRFEQRGPQESQPALHRVHLASGAAALGWPRHKSGRGTLAQSSLFQRAPRRKAQSWWSMKALQRPSEETAYTGSNHHQSWQQEAPDRDSWRSSVRKGSRKFKAERHEAAKAQTFVCLNLSLIHI